MNERTETDLVVKIDAAMDQETAARELVELGIAINVENIRAVLEQKQVPQHPEGFESILANLRNHEYLLAEMRQHNIKSIIHSEGRTVWDHVRLAIQKANTMQIDSDILNDLKIALLYHDLGKKDVALDPRNIRRTNKNLSERRSLHSAMIGHEHARSADIEQALRANGIDEIRSKRILIAIENHMNTGMATQKPLKAAEQIDLFGSTEMERKKVVELLTLLIQADGQATEHIEVVDDQITKSINTQKAQITFDSIWTNYRLGKKKAKQAEALATNKEVARLREIDIFGIDLPGYLRSRGVLDGTKLTHAVKVIKRFLGKHIDLETEVARTIIDALDLSKLGQDIPFDIASGGGNTDPFEPKAKIFGEAAMRISREQYPTLVNRILDLTRGKFANIAATDQLRDKPSYGDIDLIAQSEVRPNESTYRGIFGDDFVKCDININQDSVLVRIPPHGTYQVDFIHASTQENFETKVMFYGKGHMSQIMGMIADGAGFKYGVDGFEKKYKNRYGAESSFLISTDLRVGLRILGYDAAQYERIQTIQDILDFVQTSPFFSPDKFQTSNLKSSQRKDYDKSPQSKFLFGTLVQAAKRELSTDFDKYFKLHFPEKYNEYNMLIENERITKIKQRKPINGFLVAKYFGLSIKKDGIKVGQILTFIKENFPDAETIDDKIKEAVAQLLDSRSTPHSTPTFTPLNDERKTFNSQELRVPEVLIEERMNSFTQIIGRFVQWDEKTQTFVQRNDAPKIDRFIVPYRSGPIAIAGFRELIQKLGIESLLPQISEVHGVGYEVYHAFLDDPANVGRHQLFDISDFGESADGDRELFWKWLQQQLPDSPVGDLINKLRQIVNPDETVALLDDTYSMGTTASGVFPGMLIATLGREHVHYAIQHNQYIFPKNSGWIKAVIKQSYGESVDKTTFDKLLSDAKGGEDSVSLFAKVEHEDDELHKKLLETMMRLSEEAYSSIYERLRGRVSTI